MLRNRRLRRKRHSNDWDLKSQLRSQEARNDELQRELSDLQARYNRVEGELAALRDEADEAARLRDEANAAATLRDANRVLTGALQDAPTALQNKLVALRDETADAAHLRDLIDARLRDVNSKLIEALQELLWAKLAEDSHDGCRSSSSTGGVEEHCCIDLEPYQAGDQMVRLPCLHVHHADCVLPYLRASVTPQCPICRTRVDPSVLDNLPLFEWQPTATARQ